VHYDIAVGGELRRVTVRRADGRFAVALDGREQIVDAVRVDPLTWSLLIDGRSVEVTVVPDGSDAFAVGVESARIPVSLDGRRRWGRKDAAAGNAGERVVAPMPGKIVRVLVAAGDRVAARQPLVVVEAMKMENELRAAAPGRVTDVRAVVGQSVDAGALLVIVEGSN
jgi:biotin carboxyl carrier protein